MDNKTILFVGILKTALGRIDTYEGNKRKDRRFSIKTESLYHHGLTSINVDATLHLNGRELVFGFTTDDIVKITSSDKLLRKILKMIRSLKTMKTSCFIDATDEEIIEL